MRASTLTLTGLGLAGLAASHLVVVTQTDVVTVTPGQESSPATSSSVAAVPSSPATSSAPTSSATTSSATTSSATTSSEVTSSAVSSSAPPIGKNKEFWDFSSPESSSQPTTFVTKSSSSEEEPTSTSSTAAATSSSSSDDDSSIYADIDKSDGIDKDFAKSILDAHNEKRASHSVSKLSWDKDAYEYAQNYADQYDCSGSLTHSGGKYGENLAVGYKTGDSALDAWYDEGKSYDYSIASSFDHFTQVVWKSTTKVGCGYKDCSSENWGKYVVCSYDPAGNIIGEGLKNILN